MACWSARPRAGPCARLPRRPRGTRIDPSSQIGLFGGVRFGGISFILDGETKHERGPVAMADDYQLKYVVMVAGAIGAVVLLLGLVGLVTNLS